MTNGILAWQKKEYLYGEDLLKPFEVAQQVLSVGIFYERLKFFHPFNNN